MSFQIPRVQHTPASDHDFGALGKGIADKARDIRRKQLEKRRDTLTASGKTDPKTQAELEKLGRVIDRLKYGSDEAAAEAKRVEELKNLELEGARTSVDRGKTAGQREKVALSEEEKEAEHRAQQRPLELANLRRQGEVDDANLQKIGIDLEAAKVDLQLKHHNLEKLEESDAVLGQVKTLEGLMARPEIFTNPFLRSAYGEVLDNALKIAQIEAEGRVKPGATEKFTKGVSAGWLVFMAELKPSIERMAQLPPNERYNYMERMLQAMAGKVEEQPEMKAAFQKIYDAWLQADQGGEGGEGDQVITNAEFNRFRGALASLEGGAMILLKLTKTGGSDVAIPGLNLGGQGQDATGIINSIPMLQVENAPMSTPSAGDKPSGRLERILERARAASE